MQVIIKQGSYYQRRAIKSLVYFTARRLFSRKYRDVELHIKIMRLHGIEGQSNPHPDYLITRTNVFEIELDSRQSIKKLRYALVHELVHVRQMLRGELYLYARTEDAIKWRGKIYKQTLEHLPGDKISNADAAYWLSPWEREARGYEEGLIRLWGAHKSKRRK